MKDCASSERARTLLQQWRIMVDRLQLGRDRGGRRSLLLYQHESDDRCAKCFVLMISPGKGVLDGDAPDLQSPFGNLFTGTNTGMIILRRLRA